MKPMMKNRDVEILAKWIIAISNDDLIMANVYMVEMIKRGYVRRIN